MRSFNLKACNKAWLTQEKVSNVVLIGCFFRISWAKDWATILRQATYSPRDSRSMSVVQDKTFLQVDKINLMFPWKSPSTTVCLAKFRGRAHSSNATWRTGNLHGDHEMGTLPPSKWVNLIKYAWNHYFYTDYGSHPEKSEILLDKILAPVDMANSPWVSHEFSVLRVPSVPDFLPSIVAAVCLVHDPPGVLGFHVYYKRFNLYSASWQAVAWNVLVILVKFYLLSFV